MSGPLFIFSFFIEHLNNVGQQMFFSLHTTSSAMYMRGSANRTELISVRPCQSDQTLLN